MVSCVYSNKMVENQKTTVSATTQYFASVSANSIMVGYGCAIGKYNTLTPKTPQPEMNSIT